MTVKVLGVAELPIDELVPYPGNTRRGNVAVIMESIREFGQYRPLVCRQREGKPPMVLAGNHTLALAGLRYETARVELIECDDETARKINVIDNRSSDLGSFDDVALAVQLESFGGDFTGTGFSVQDFEKLMSKGMPEPGDAPTDDDGDGQWGVVAELDTEQEQAELLGELADRGIRVRALING